MPPSQPPAPITFLFADLEGSSTGWQEYGDAFRDALQAMHALARECVQRHRGTYEKHTGDGFILTFGQPADAVHCAVDLQTTLLGQAQAGDGPPLLLRIGIHTDTPSVADGEYTGLAVWRAQRVMDAARGGQILLSETTHALARYVVGVQHDCVCEPLGEFRLRELREPICLYRVSVPGLPFSTQPPRALARGCHNLPEEERPFIGRQDEVRAVTRLLRNPRARVVTITGIGGIGKSRLARQVAHEMAGDFPGGVWLVELDAFETRDEVRAAIRGVLPFEVAAGFPDEPASVPTDMAPLLLILDCFERLLPHAGLVERIVQVAPQVRCLVTSRAILGLPREFEYPLEPMPAGEEADGGIGDPSDSVRLFEEAASHAVPGFRLTPANRESVERLCLALEGIPLSIILAAARLRYLSVAELLSRVRVRRFDVLRRHAPGYDRHAALQQVVADSLALLAPRDQQLLYVLSLFVGGFFLEDAEDVCGPERGADALEGISRLREHSLLSTHPVGDQTRLRLLDTIREYISGLQWDEGTEADLLRCRRRHAAHYAETAQRIDALMQRGQWAEGSALLWREIGNLRAAAGFSIECGDDEMVAVYAESLGRIYHEAGLWEDCDRLADAADAAADRLQRPVLRASMLGLKGAGAARRGDREEARRLWEQRVDLSLSVGDTVAAADQLLDLAAQSQEEGDLAGARRLLRRAIRLVGPHDRSGLLAAARAIQAGIALAEGRPSDARRGADRARDAIRPQADPATALYVYSRLGHIYPELGEADQGEAALRKAIRLAAEGNRDFSLIGALLELGELYESQRQMERAAQVYAVASQIHPELPSRRRDAAAAALARFQRETPGPQIRRLIEDARLKPWQDSLADLLEDPDLARAVAQAASDRPAEPGFYRNAGRATPLP